MSAARPPEGARIAAVKAENRPALAAHLTRRSLLGGFGALAAAGLPLGAFAAADGLAGVKARGALTVAVYNDMPPFNDRGRGIDVDIAGALAESLGVKLSLMPFPAGEEMDDDLRNMVWKGHYLGYGPADVMLHVPVEAPLMDASPQVRIFAPYWHDSVMIARNVEQLPHLETLAQLNGKSVAVSGQTLAGLLMMGADGGAYRNQLTTSWKDGVEAAAALKRGEFAAAAGLQSELQSVLAGDPRFVITPLPTLHNSRAGWAVGLAVKKDAADLAEALQKAVNDLAAGDRLKQIFAKAHLDWHAV